MALSFPKTFEAPHFDRTSFRALKKIFATMEEEKKLANIKLSPIDQDVFCKFDRSIIYPVPNKWGLQGWTQINLTKVPKAMLQDALATAYATVLGKGAKP